MAAESISKGRAHKRIIRNIDVSSENHIERLDYRGYVLQGGRVYQQGQGDQLNIENAYFGSLVRPTPFLLPAADWPSAREMDPIDLGVHRSAIKSGNAVPSYVQRDVDGTIKARLSECIANGGMLLIVGDSATGKTRSAYEALVDVAPNHKVLMPPDRHEARAYIAAGLQSRQPCVVWLDDLERYIGPNGVTSQVVAFLSGSNVTVVATMRSEHFRSLAWPSRDRMQNEGQHPSLRDHAYDNASQFLQQQDPILIPRLWSDEEIDRAEISTDTRIGDALKHHRTYGVAEYLAAGPQLFGLWKMANGVEGNPRGAAVIAAAIDLARAGLVRGIPLYLLEKTHHWYLDASGGALLRPESFDMAIQWCRQRRYGVTSLLLPKTANPDLYHAFDYLHDQVVRDTPSPVPDHVWEAALHYAETSDRDLFPVGYVAAQAGKVDIAGAAWRRLAERGNVPAIHNYGLLCVKQGLHREAERMWRESARAGNYRAALDLGLFFQERGRKKEAERWLREAVKSGDEHAAYHLADLLREDNRTREAKEWLSIAARDNQVGAKFLRFLIDEEGNAKELEDSLKREIATGNTALRHHLGELYFRTSRLTEAEAVWKQAMNDGDIDSALELGRFYLARNKFAHAEQIFRDAAESGKVDAQLSLAGMLVRTGREAEAVGIWEAVAEQGYTSAIYNLGLAAFRKRKLDDAHRWWLQGSELGDRYSTAAIGELLVDQNKLIEARHFLELAANEGDSVAACSLGRLLSRTRDFESAIVWLCRSRDAGHEHAACVLGSIFEWQGRLAEAEESFLHAYNHGHHHAAEMLERFYASGGQFKKASIWLRKSKEGKVAQHKRTQGVSAKERKRRRSKRKR